MNAIILHKIRLVPLAGSVLASLLLSSGETWAADYNAGADGDWNVPTNWDPAGLPGLGDTATIGSGFTVTVTDSQSIAGLTLSAADSSAGTLSVGNNGSLTAAAAVNIGAAAGANGTLTVNTGGSFTSSLADGLAVGFLHGAGALNIDGGTVISTGVAYIGNFGTATGAVNVSAGSWTGASSLYLGRDNGATGTLDISGGSVGSGSVLVGVNAGGSGTLTVRNTGALTATGAIIVGNEGAGVLNLTGGSITSAGVVLGNEAGTGSGTVEVSGGTWNNESISIGLRGSGELTVSGGTINSSDSVALSTHAGSSGTLNIVGGAFNVNGALYMASVAGSVGELNFGTGGTVGTLSVGVAGVVGGAGTATVNFNHTGSSNNALNFGGSLSVNQIGEGATTLSGVNTYTGATVVSDGTLLLESSLVNTSEIVVSGGVLAIGAADLINNDATLTLSGGTFSTKGFSESLGALTLTDSTTSFLDFGSGISTLLFSGITSDTGTLVVTNWTFGSDSLRFTSDLNLNASSFLINGESATIMNRGTYYEVVGVPEPGVFAMLLVGIGMTALITRRRCQKTN